MHRIRPTGALHTFVASPPGQPGGPTTPRDATHFRAGTPSQDNQAPCPPCAAAASSPASCWRGSCCRWAWRSRRRWSSPGRCSWSARSAGAVKAVVQTDDGAQDLGARPHGLPAVRADGRAAAGNAGGAPAERPAARPGGPAHSGRAHRGGHRRAVAGARAPRSSPDLLPSMVHCVSPVRCARGLSRNRRAPRAAGAQEGFPMNRTMLSLALGAALPWHAVPAVAQTAPPAAAASADPAPERTKIAGRRHRDRRPADLAADADPDHHRGHHARGDRDPHQRHRQRGRAQVPAQPAGAQALHRRLQPRDPVDPRLGHRQQRALGGVRRRHPAVELPGQRHRQRHQLRAALGPGHARGDRARRRDVRAVLGRLSRQFRRRRGRLRDAHADPAGSACQGRLLVAAQRPLQHPPDLQQLADQRVDRQPQRRGQRGPVVVVDRRQPHRQPRPAADLHHRHGGLGRRSAAPARRSAGYVRRPQHHQHALVHPRHRHGLPHDAGPRQAQARLRLLAHA